MNLLLASNNFSINLNNFLQYRFQQAYWPSDQLLVYNPDKLTWQIVQTKGDLPGPTCGATAQIVQNDLYVICGFRKTPPPPGEQRIYTRQEDEECVNTVYALSLSDWTWRKVKPKGQPPMDCDKLASWVYNNTIYIFGGFGIRSAEELPAKTDFFKDNAQRGLDFVTRGWTNQLVALNVNDCTWSWPETTGPKPLPRAAHTAFTNESNVFIFGGRFSDRRLNDLYHLDMNTMAWSEIQSEMPNDCDNIPVGRSWHSLTKISNNTAILYGGYANSSIPLQDCWLLKVGKPNEIDRDKMWTRLPHLEVQTHLWHQTVKERRSGQLWIIGGVINDLLKSRQLVYHPRHMTVLTLTPLPLVNLCIQFVRDNYERFDEELKRIPDTLRKLLDYYIRRTNGG